MSDNVWFPLYWGDYIKATGDILMIEHGAYLLLMGHYYSTGKPLPDDEARLYRICKAITDDEKNAIWVVLKSFFVKVKTGYKHHRIDAELKKQKDISKKRRAAAKIKHEKFRAANAGANDVQVDTQSQPQSHSQPSLDEKNLKKDLNPARKHPKPKKKTAKPMLPKNLDEVVQYAQSRDSSVDPKTFWEHYEAANPPWHDKGGDPVRAWKQKFCTWERREDKKRENEGSIFGRYKVLS